MKIQPNSLAVVCKHSTMSKRILLGVASYLNSSDYWSIAPFEKLEDMQSTDIVEHYSGLIVVDEKLPDIDLLEVVSKRLPVVYLGCSEHSFHCPELRINEKEVARIAAMALLDRGFHSIAFVGEAQNSCSKQLQTAFSNELRDNGIAPFIFMSHTSPVQDGLMDGNQKVMRRRLSGWIESLPRQTAVFAADDALALEVYKAASRLNYAIPYDIAILGVNDDDLFCKIMNPSLSSIRLPFEKMGHDAAKMVLSEIPNGTQDAQKLNKVYKPMGFIARGSTKVIVAKDPIVKAAVNYIHDNYMHPINVENILEELDVSRSLLERRFREELGVTPLVELRRQRIERARAMLSDSNERIHDMGRRCGFSSAIRFTTVFKEQVGITPTEFRKQMLPNSAK